MQVETAISEFIPKMINMENQGSSNWAAAVGRGNGVGLCARELLKVGAIRPSSEALHAVADRQRICAA